MTASQPHCGTLCTGYRSSNMWSLSCRCWCLTVCITWNPAICLPCASWSPIMLVVVTYTQQHVVILLFQPQGRSDTVLAASPWQDRPPGTLCQHRYSAAILHPRSVVIWKLNCLSERITSTLFVAVRVGECNFSAHRHHEVFSRVAFISL